MKSNDFSNTPIMGWDIIPTQEDIDKLWDDVFPAEESKKVDPEAKLKEKEDFKSEFFKEVVEVLNDRKAYEFDNKIKFREINEKNGSKDVDEINRMSFKGLSENFSDELELLKKKNSKPIDFRSEEYHESLRDTVRKAQQTEYEQDRKFIWVAEDVSKKPPFFVGYCYIVHEKQLDKSYLVKNEKFETVNFVENIRVKEKYRNRKIGSRLLLKGVEYLFHKGKGIPVYLECLTRNRKALKFYKELGGITTTEQPIIRYYWGGEERVYFFRWKDPKSLIIKLHKRITETKVEKEEREEEKKSVTSSHNTRKMQVMC